MKVCFQGPLWYERIPPTFSLSGNIHTVTEYLSPKGANTFAHIIETYGTRTKFKTQRESWIVAFTAQHHHHSEAARPHCHQAMKNKFNYTDIYFDVLDAQRGKHSSSRSNSRAHKRHHSSHPLRLEQGHKPPLRSALFGGWSWGFEGDEVAVAVVRVVGGGGKGG